MPLKAEDWMIFSRGRESGERCGPRGGTGALGERTLPPLDGAWRQLTIGLVVAASLVGGCTTAQVREERTAPTGIMPGEAIAILTTTDSSLETEAVGCISKAVRTAMPTARIITPDEFRGGVFSARPPDDEAERTKYLALLASEPAISDRMNALGIRYLIAVGGQTKRTGQLDVGGASAGLGGLLGMRGEHRESRLTASVLDLKEGRPSGELNATASGTPWFAVVVIVPLGWHPFTETRVCSDIGEKVVNYLTGKITPRASGSREPRER